MKEEAREAIVQTAERLQIRSFRHVPASACRFRARTLWADFNRRTGGKSGIVDPSKAAKAHFWTAVADYREARFTDAAEQVRMALTWEKES
jgi:hypothetical protein